MAETQDMQAAIRSLRLRIEELERKQPTDVSRYSAPAVALAIGMVVLTATTWVVDEEKRYTLWGLVPEGWQALVMLGLVVGTAAVTSVMFTYEHPTRVGHLVMVWVSLLVAVWVIVIGGVLPEDAETEPAPWLVLVGALAVAAAHGARAEELYGRR